MNAAIRAFFSLILEGNTYKITIFFDVLSRPCEDVGYYQARRHISKISGDRGNHQADDLVTAIKILLHFYFRTFKILLIYLFFYPVCRWGPGEWSAMFDVDGAGGGGAAASFWFTEKH